MSGGTLKTALARKAFNLPSDFIAKVIMHLVMDSLQPFDWDRVQSILPENLASLKLVTKCGFREVGRRERLGKLDGPWRDVLLLERRSRVVGA